MKKLFTLFLLTLLPVLASAEAVEINGIYYNLNSEDKTAEVTKNPDKYSGEVIIPESVTFDGIDYCVNTIGREAFDLCYNLTDVIIPNSVISIGFYAFRQCDNLHSIVIPSSVKSIDVDSFFGCMHINNITVAKENTVYDSREDCNAIIETAVNRIVLGCANTVIPSSVTGIGADAFSGSQIKTIEIPEQVTFIGSGAFAYCNVLTSVVLGKGLTFLPRSSFKYCVSLTSVNFGDKLETIDEGAFYGCTSLAELYIPKNITELYHGFIGCPGLEKIIVDDGNEVYDSRNNCNAVIVTKSNCIQVGCKNTIIPNDVIQIGSCSYMESGINSITIPSHVEIVNDQVFYVCKDLKRITISSNNTSIGKWAFGGCNNVTDVFCLTDVVPNVNSKCFEYQDGSTFISNATLHVPASSIEAYKATEPWSKFKEIVSLPRDSYTLTYMVDGVIYKIYELSKGDAITPEPAPTKEGYTFSGWSDIPATMPANDVTVTGTFTINRYKLTYQVDGVTYKEYDVEYGAAITPEPEPTKEGYTFSGWSDIPATMPAKDVTVTGAFTKNEANTYTLTYKVDGAVYKTYQLAEGTAISPEPEPTKEGYTFSGWSDIPKTMPAKDVTVIGTFTKNDVKTYTLTYKVDGVVYKTYQVAEGATITPEPAPTKEGYTFSGWNDLPSTMPAHDVTATGSFTINTYKLKYKIDGVTYKEYYLEFGAPIIPEPEPIKEGYTFSGWSDIPETMPAHKVTVEGSFTKNEEPEQEITQDNVVYKIDGDHVTVTQADDASGDLIIEGTVTINGEFYDVTIIAEDAFKDCTEITSVDIPNSITIIEEKAFEGCTGLHTIKIGSGILEIARKAFANINTSGTNTRGDDNSLHLYCEADVVPETSEEAFVGTDIANATLHVLDNMVETYKLVSPWNGFGTIVGLSDTGILTIGIESSDAQIFDLQGNRLSKPRRGMNIIRTSDGKTNKVLVK